MNTHIDINKPVLDRLIQCGCITFAPETISSDIAQTLREVDRHLQKLRSKNQWHAFNSWRSTGYETFEEHVNFLIMKDRHKERVATARRILAPLLQVACSTGDIRFIAGFLAETFMLEFDYETALFWLRVAEGGSSD